MKIVIALILLLCFSCTDYQRQNQKLKVEIKEYQVILDSMAELVEKYKRVKEGL